MTVLAPVDGVKVTMRSVSLGNGKRRMTRSILKGEFAPKIERKNIEVWEPNRLTPVPLAMSKC